MDSSQLADVSNTEAPTQVSPFAYCMSYSFERNIALPVLDSLNNVDDLDSFHDEITLNRESFLNNVNLTPEEACLLAKMMYIGNKLLKKSFNLQISDMQNKLQIALGPQTPPGKSHSKSKNKKHKRANLTSHISQKRNKTSESPLKLSNSFDALAVDDDDIINDSMDIPTTDVAVHHSINPNSSSVPSPQSTTMENVNNDSSITPEANSVTNVSTGQEQNKNNESEKEMYIPPIIVDQATNTKALLNELNQLTGTPITGRCMGGKLKIFPTTAEAHRAIRRYVDQNKLKAHTYELPEEKQMKIVIRGLPSDFSTQDIDTELKRYGFNPVYIAPLKHRNFNSNPLFLVILPKTEASKKIYDIYTIDYMRVKVEPLKRRTQPGQCYNCQQYFHSSRQCTRDPVSLKCAGPHATRQCQKQMDTPAKCALCGGDHTANYSGCPKHPSNLIPPEPPASRWSAENPLSKTLAASAPKAKINLPAPINRATVASQPQLKANNTNTSVLLTNRINKVTALFSEVLVALDSDTNSLPHVQ
ncbi:Nucleic-acid-binding protein from transposon X-element [Araneus ventricosus]|uniref:Nucleic-acid-binding protein from transposon X-element n=1 Tax=Araneus ventricosus TaxID=182803 RepID=A0A4Y2W7Y6_ARAVE|nr:Nucleic-acid-binding protein from transposon X-element [Araneus ventricosus]